MSDRQPLLVLRGSELEIEADAREPIDVHLGDDLTRALADVGIAVEGPVAVRPTQRAGLGVTASGRRLALSRRRARQLSSATSGPHLARALLATTVRANLPGLVSLAGAPAGSPAALAAKLGVGPLRDLDDQVIDDPYRRLPMELFPDDEAPPPVDIIVNRAGLRRLSMPPAAVGSSSTAVEPRTPPSIRPTLWTVWGTVLPPIQYEVDEELSDTQFELRFGGVRTGPFALLPAEHVAVASTPEQTSFDAHDSWLDPLLGEEYTVLRREDVPDTAVDAGYLFDAPAVVMRTLYAEARLCAAWWMPDDVTSRFAPTLAQPLADMVSADLVPTMRWCMAEGLPAAFVEPALEGLFRSLATGTRSIPDHVDAVRSALGPGVLAPHLRDGVTHTVRIDDTLSGDLVENGISSDREELRFLTESSMSTLVVCPPARRAEVAEVLHPLRDVFIVTSESELPPVESREDTRHSARSHAVG